MFYLCTTSSSSQDGENGAATNNADASAADFGLVDTLSTAQVSRNQGFRRRIADVEVIVVARIGRGTVFAKGIGCCLCLCFYFRGRCIAYCYL